MARVSERLQADGDPILEKLFAAEQDHYGCVLNPTRALAHCPPILKAAKQLYASIDESGLLPPALLALVYVRVASLNGCPF